MISATRDEPLSTQLPMRRAPGQAPLPADCLKPKVFLRRRSIRQIRAPGKNLRRRVRARRLNSPVPKGEALPACPFGNAILSRAEASARGSIDAKIILWLKYFGRWNGARLRRASTTNGLCVSSAFLLWFEDRHAPPVNGISAVRIFWQSFVDQATSAPY